MTETNVSKLPQGTQDLGTSLKALGQKDADLKAARAQHAQRQKDLDAKLAEITSAVNAMKTKLSTIKLTAAQRKDLKAKIGPLHEKTKAALDALTKKSA